MSSSFSDTISPESAADLYCRIASANPFTTNRINAPSLDEVDVESLHAGAFERMTTLARESLRSRRGLGALLLGEAGIGKSHLLARLGRWAEQEPATLVYLHNLQAAPGNLPRAVLRAVVGSLTWREGRSYHRTPLFALVDCAVQRAMGAESGFHQWSVLEHGFRRQLGQLGLGGAAAAGISDRTAIDVLFAFYRSVRRTLQGKEDGAAARAAVQWLQGETVEPDAGRLLDLPPARRHEDPVGLEDNQQIKQVLVVLTGLAACCDQPFLVCFDQVDNLDREQFASLARFLEALLDSSRNLLAVTAGIQQSLLGWREERVIQESAWDRVAQFRLVLQRLTPDQALPLVEKRLQHFLVPHRLEPRLLRMIDEDPLFPLGRRWYDKAMEGRLEVRPRDVLSEACEAWFHEQQVLARLGGDKWLAAWRDRKNGSNGGPPPKGWTEDQLQEAIDRAVGEEVATYRAAAAGRIPDRESLSESVAQLLQVCQENDSAGEIEEVDVVDRGRTSTPPTYDIIVHHRGEDGNAGPRTGLVFAPGCNAYAMVHVLARMREVEAPPARVLLFTDPDGPPLGDRGEEHLEALHRRAGCELKILQVPPEGFAEIEALHAVWNMARSDDLQLVGPDGKPRLIAADEVSASHCRKGRFRQSIVLSAALEPLRAARSAAATMAAPRVDETMVMPVSLGPVGVDVALVEESHQEPTIDEAAVTELIEDPLRTATTPKPAGQKPEPAARRPAPKTMAEIDIDALL